MMVTDLKSNGPRPTAKHTSMKLQTIFLYIILIALFACEKDEDMVTIKTDAVPASITSTAAELSAAITQETLGNEITIHWNETDYGVNTEVTYTLELDAACNGFQNPVSLGSTTKNSFTTTLDVLNSKLLTSLNLAQHLTEDVQLRVKSQVKNNFEQTSAPVTLTLTPWNAWSKALWLLSDGWTVASAPAIYESGTAVFDGYVYLNGQQDFKLADTRTCAKTTFGDSGGQLSSTASSTDFSLDSGYYRIKANTENLSYEFITINSFGLIGSATPGGWGASTPMTYNPTAQVWEATADLTGGALKFRANNDWAINYGPANSDAMDGTLLLDDPGAISIPGDGNYTITLDLSKRKSPALTYTVKKNLAGSFTSLWLPGEYQGWSPGTAPTIKSVNANAYEGYVYISAPTGYKFTSAPDWDHINYGDAGTPGTLTTDGLAGGLGLSSAGLYKFNVNVSTLTYSAVLINTIGMIGTATPGGWDSSTAMTYDQPNDVWKATINLVAGALKFRANNEWTINYGPADSGALQGTLIFDDPGAINITEAGSYTVTVDFSRSESPYKYTYSVVKN
jgi:starch-binding outer membrane protein SusE/F